MTSLQSNVLFTSLVCLGTSLFACGEVVVQDGDSGSGNPAEAPTIAEVSPARASLKGTTEISITGTGFSEDTQVVIGASRVSDVTIASESELTFLAPAGIVAEEPLDVSVFNESGFGFAPDAITYNIAPTIESVTPNFAALAGGTTVTIKGENFQENNEGTPSITVGDTAATDVVVVDNQTITAVVGAGDAANVALTQDLAVETTNGDMSLAESITIVRPGLLFGTSRNENEHGIYFYDVPTKRFVRIVASDANVGRLVKTLEGDVIVRFGNQGLAPFAAEALGRLEPSGELVPEFVLRRDGTTSTSRIGSMTNLGPVLFGFDRNAGTFGSITPATEEFATLVSVPGMGQSTCMAPGPAQGSVLMVNRFEDSIRIVDTEILTVATGAALTGDITPGNQVRCHGGTIFGGQFFAIEFDRSNFKSRLVTINPENGFVTFIGDLPGSASGLVETPASF